MSTEPDGGLLFTAARLIRWLAIPVIVFWVVLTAALNTVTPPLAKVASAHAVSLSAHDAPSLTAMKRVGKDFQQFDSDSTAMVVLEGRDKLGDSAHRYYDTLIAKLSEDKTHVEHIENFWGDPLTAAGSQSTDGKAAYVQLYLAGDQSSSRANESVASVERIVHSVPAPDGDQGLRDGPRAARRRSDTHTAIAAWRRSPSSPSS